MSLHLREVTSDNWRSVAALRVSENQEAFIESNAFSMAESLYEHNGTSLGLYDGDVLVGYAMYGWHSAQDSSVWLDRFMVDHNYQGKGYAKRFLTLLLAYLQNKFACSRIYLSLHPENTQAMKLYESYGFRLTGAIDEDGPVKGVVMALSTSQAAGTES